MYSYMSLDVKAILTTYILFISAAILVFYFSNFLIRTIIRGKDYVRG